MITQKLKYFDHIKHNSGLKQTVIEGMVPERIDRNQLAWRWVQGIKDLGPEH